MRIINENLIKFLIGLGIPMSVLTILILAYFVAKYLHAKNIDGWAITLAVILLPITIIVLIVESFLIKCRLCDRYRFPYIETVCKKCSKSHGIKNIMDVHVIIEKIRIDKEIELERLNTARRRAHEINNPHVPHVIIKKSTKRSFKESIEKDLK